MTPPPAGPSEAFGATETPASPIDIDVLPATILLTGTVGAGKTTTAEAIGDLLREAGVPNAVIDLDRLRQAWPPPHGDPFNVALELRNLRDVARNMRDAGARVVVLAGVLEEPSRRADYTAAAGGPLVVCRLRVDLDRVAARLRERHRPGAALDWHLARSGELDAILDRLPPADVEVAVGAEPPAAVAAAVLGALV